MAASVARYAMQRQPRQHLLGTVAGLTVLRFGSGGRHASRACTGGTTVAAQAAGCLIVPVESSDCGSSRNRIGARCSGKAPPYPIIQAESPHTPSFRCRSDIPMGCQDKARIAAEASAVATRIEICSECDHNVEGVCQLLKHRCPAKDAVVAIGCEIASSYCPDGKWDRLPIRQPCSLCGAVHRSVDGICPKCKKNR